MSLDYNYNKERHIKANTFDKFKAILPKDNPVEQQYIMYNSLRQKINPTCFHNADIPITFNQQDVLIIVDMQNDFIEQSFFDKGGSSTFKSGLGVPHSSTIVDCISSLIYIVAEYIPGANIVATMDAHTPDHASFQGPNGFPSHCVRNAAQGGNPDGILIVKPIEQMLKHSKLSKNANVIYAIKAYHKDYDSFGAFPYNEAYAKDRIAMPSSATVQDLSNFTGAIVPSDKITWQTIEQDELIKERMKCIDKGDADADCQLPSLDYILDQNKNEQKNKKLFLCGLLGDFCVLDTAVTAKLKGYEVYIIFDMIRSGLDDKTGMPLTPLDRWKTLLEQYGIKLCLVTDLDIFYKFMKQKVLNLTNDIVIEALDLKD